MNINQNHKTLFIIGNGFDLDLKLNTSYEHFLQSEYFTKYLGYDTISSYKLESLNSEINIFSYLKYKRKIKGWIDVETELANLASRKVKELSSSPETTVHVSDLEKSSFQQLRISLCDYLKSINYDHLNTASYGLVILDILNSSRTDSELITFNYTDINKLSCFIRGSHIDIPVSYMHGRLDSRKSPNDDTSIILGFQDEIEIDDSYCFMIKSHSPYYESHNLKSKLNQADEVIFFGHSLGSTDYPYFADFFRKQCATKPDNEKIKVRIFTYDEESRQNILLQLRNMNERHTQMLYEYCDFAIYRTKDNMDKEKIEAYIADLKGRVNSSYVSLPLRG